jgi:hypothetical protein
MTKALPGSGRRGLAVLYAAIRPAPEDSGGLLLVVTSAGFLSRNADAARKKIAAASLSDRFGEAALQRGG